MARITNAAITRDDAKYMVDNEGWTAKAYEFLVGLECMNKLEIELYLEAYVPDTYDNNQLPTYNNFFKAMVTDPQTSVFVPNTAGTTSVTIYPIDSGAWTASEATSWFSISPSFGTGATAVIVTYVANVTTSARSGIITFVDTGTGSEREFTVQQAAGVGVPTTPVSVSGGGVSLADACTRYPSYATTLYIPSGESWSAPSLLYNNSAGTTYAPAGYYSTATLARYWNGTGFSGSLSCP